MLLPLGIDLPVEDKLCIENLSFASTKNHIWAHSLEIPASNNDFI